ncbi:MAG: hypothetical protein ACYC7A_12350 [Thermoanaerobaculia bacterium]
MTKLALVLLIGLVAWFAFKVARFALRLFAFVVLLILIAIAYFKFSR